MTFANFMKCLRKIVPLKQRSLSRLTYKNEHTKEITRIKFKKELLKLYKDKYGTR